MAAPQLINIESRITVDCRICGGSRFSDYLEGRSYQIVECANCGLRFVNPQPTDRELQAFYAGFDLESTWRGDGEERFDRSMRDFVLRFRGSGTVLDVGSSRGNFLLAMAGAGFSVYGVEPSPKNSEFARTANGIDCYTGSIEQFLNAPTRGDFDVITVLNVIEHLPDPKAVLCGLRDLMAKDGLLILAVPDSRLHALIGETRRKLKFSDPFWMNTRKHPLVGFDPPAHLCSFDPVTISRLAEQCGFETLSVRNAPIIINQDMWKNAAKTVLHAFSELIYFASAKKILIGYSTMLAARRID